MEVKLRKNNDHFANANDKLSYSVMRLKGVARQQFLPFNSDVGSLGIQDVDAAINIPRTAFDVADTPAISQRKLFAIAQGSQPLNIFLAKGIPHANKSSMGNALSTSCSSNVSLLPS
ncbi:hypothetical protein BJ878DRAFT_480991 [Calycina marina]|uniref:Uncharacterized protein n=1 Tax=Calycina marina TaxID=1763456 RepID=A0A9P7Z1L6_9HELO|nr:hypothetical protein BJ878DRAFT_480991 [Calycina marina]